MIVLVIRQCVLWLFFWLRVKTARTPQTLWRSCSSVCGSGNVFICLVDDNKSLQNCLHVVLSLFIYIIMNRYNTFVLQTSWFYKHFTKDIVLQKSWKTLPVYHILHTNNTPVFPAPPRIIHLCLFINWCVESDVLGAMKILKCALQGGLQEQNWENTDLQEVLIYGERTWLPSVFIPEAIRKLKKLLFMVLKDETL